MLGKTDRQTTFSDLWLENKIPKNSYWYRIHDWVINNLSDKMFQPLYSFYGRPSVSPIYTFAAFLIQFEKGYSDRELEGETTFDDRVKFAITAPRDFLGIDAVTLCDHRSRLFKSDIGRKIFIQIIEKAKEEGMFKEENLHVIDSFMVWGSAAKQDTYTMLFSCIKMILKLCSFYELSDKAKAVLKREDYYIQRRKPRINWEDKKEKIKLLDELVIDGLNLISFVRENAKEENQDLLETAQLLEKIIIQDTFKDEDGKYKITKGTAKDRIISTIDKEMRHGHKTSSKIQDGYKAEIITAGKRGELVIAADIMSANSPDGTKMEELLNEAKETGNKIDKLYGDSAYNNWNEINKRNDETEFCVKVRNAVNKNGMYTKDEFEIDLDNGIITCPMGESVSFDIKKEIGDNGMAVQFDNEKCKKCPKKDNCTNSKTGRAITINKNEKQILEAKKYQKTEEFKSDYAKRSNGERTISELTKHGGRQGRYIGIKKTSWQILMCAINNNIKRLMKYIEHKEKDKNLLIRGEVCPFLDL